MYQKLGITQFKGQKPKQSISIGGYEWKLRRDASDPTSSFPHELVNWINAGCDPIGDGTVYACWIHGLVPPKQDTQERPVQVMYVGFHTAKVFISPNTVMPVDADSMHIYITDGGDFSKGFINSFLGIKAPETVQSVQARAEIAPTPDLDMSILSSAMKPKEGASVELPEQSEIMGDPL